MISKITFFALIIFPMISFAQQSNPNLVHYFENIGLYNPAATAWKTDFSSTINYRGFLSSSNPYRFHYAMAFIEKDFDAINSGIGLNFSNEQFVWTNMTYAGLSYRYRINFKEKTSLSVGAALNYHRHALDASEFSDPIFQSDKYIGNTLLANVGLWFIHKSFSLGISSLNVNAPKMRLSPETSLTFQFARFFHVQSAIDLIINRKLTCTPRVFLAHYQSGTEAMFSVEFNVIDKLFLAPGFRFLPSLMQNTQNNYGLSLSLKGEFISNWNLGLAYEYFKTPWNQHAFELMLSYRVKR